MTVPFLWTLEKVQMLRDGWTRGERVADIGARLGTSRSSVIAKASRLRLGQHPEYDGGGPGHHGDEPVKRDVVKPVIGFQGRRLSWEE